MKVIVRETCFLVKIIRRTIQFHEFFRNISILYPYQNHEMWITWKVIVRETCFCEKILADFTISWIFQKYFNFVLMLESRNWITWKVIVRETCFCENNQADYTVSWVLQKYFNFVPMLESRNVDHMKSNCSWDMFLWKNSGGLHSFMSFSEIFQLCAHARIT